MIRNIDIDVLRSFVCVYESKNFSIAAETLGRTQSTISQQIKKLEDLLQTPLFLRTNRHVSLTTQGEVLLPYARKILDLNDEAFGRITNPDISGTVKLGAPEAFAANHLPNVLVQFAKSHPSVALDVHCDLSHNLHESFERGEFDLILIKRDDKSKIYGNRVWHETLDWVGQEKIKFTKKDVIPLVVSPFPCVYRNKVIACLEKNKLRWNAVFTSASMTSRIAAAKAGLGVTVIPTELLSQSHNLFSLNQDSGLPRLPHIEIDLIQKEERMSDAAKRLGEHIIFALENDPSIGKAV